MKSLNEMYDGIKNGFEWKYGLRVYPLKVRNYNLNRLILGCLEYMQQAMPYPYLAMPYLRMIHNMADDKIEGHEYDTILLHQLMMESFRLPPGCFCSTTDNNTKEIRWFIYCKKALDESGDYETINDSVRDIILKTADEEMLASQNIYVVTETDFNNLRELICEINAVEIPDENVNLEIWLSDKQIREQNKEDLDYSFTDMFFSYKTISQKTAEEVFGMSMWEFANELKAINRRILHAIYTLSANSGNVKYKDGNPYPDWRFDKITKNKMGMSTYQEFQNKMKKAT